MNNSVPSLPTTLPSLPTTLPSLNTTQPSLNTTQPSLNTTQTDNITNVRVENRKCEDGKYIYRVFHVMMSLVAILLSMRCNEGVNYLSLIIAFCFPYPYIIYSLIYNKGICEKK